MNWYPTIQIFLSFCFLFLLPAALAQQQLLQPAPVSCNARYSAPCARTNSKWLANHVANLLLNITTDEESLSILRSITNQEFNRDSGFYPFVFDRNTGRCIAHGANPAFQGQTIQQIFDAVGIAFADGNALHQRFVEANHEWVQYLWVDEGRVNSKLAYVVNITNTDYYLGIGYENVPLPQDTPCQDDYDGWCSLTDVRSIVGKAQFALYQAESLESFEQTIFRISFDDDEFKIPGGFYLFMYHFDGRLKAHGVLRQDGFGKSLSEIFVDKKLGTAQEGQALHQQFINAVTNQDSAFVTYEWRNSLDEDPHTKIAFLVKVSFGNDDFYVGAGYNFAVDDYLSAPLGQPCRDDYNLPCSFRTAYQLSAHALSYAIASPIAIYRRFMAITRDSQFKHQDYYVFVYTFDNRCVAHGGNEEFVGMSLNQVFESIQIDLNATRLHEKFVNAARQGGGWVLYDWLNLANGDGFEKISYVFQLNIDGQDYYGGVGFNHQRFPVKVHSERGLTNSGQPIPCSAQYGLDCSEANARAILGQALASLTLSSSEASAVQAEYSKVESLEDILNSITMRTDGLFSVNDFFVIVFSFEDNIGICQTHDGTGCAVAHGRNPEYVGLTWTEILDMEGITAIQGASLHNQLMDQSNTGGGVVEYPWKGTSKKAWVSRFRHFGKSYYVLAEYSTTEMPPTCDACPTGMHCTEDSQYICVEDEGPAAWLVALAVVLGVLLVGVYYQNWRTRNRKRAYKEKTRVMAKQLEAQMQGMYEIKSDLLVHSPRAYCEKLESDKKEKTRALAVWYWEEDPHLLKDHYDSFLLAGTNYVAFSREVCGQLEHSFQLYKEDGYAQFRIDLAGKVASSKTGRKVSNCKTGHHYEIDFEKEIQRNTSSNHLRSVLRKEASLSSQAPSQVSLPPLPEGVKFEGKDRDELLPVVKGQIIQVSKSHPDNNWLYGTVLYDPLLEDAMKKSEGAGSEGLNAVLSNALHDRATAGWFPTSLAETADIKSMTTLLENLGGEGAGVLETPEEWDLKRQGRVGVQAGSEEFISVEQYFLDAMFSQRSNVTVTQIERIQNIPLWQSYALKTQTMRTRDRHHPDHLVNNKDSAERKWLFHGTRAEIVKKIETQGFNRSFAGHNAVAYGKGVYFARDAVYSSQKIYSQPDVNGIQRMFLCRVAVGDWCRGKDGALTPDPKPHNALELFDSTVDNVSKPSIFVVYHDAQSYPEYLVSFKRKD